MNSVRDWNFEGLQARVGFTPTTGQPLSTTTVRTKSRVVNTMPSATMPSLSEDEIDDLLYFARIGDLQELLSSIEAFAKSTNSTQSSVLSAAVDEQSGNGILHMASANGHTGKSS